MDPSPTALPTRDHCLAPGRDRAGDGGYGRLFADLPALGGGESYFATQGVAAIRGSSDLFRHDVDRDDDPGLPAAGWPVLAQFLAHDLTADRSALSSRVELHDLQNARLPRLDLECVYGARPADHPYLVQRSAPSRMLVAEVDGVLDLPRNHEGTALVGDARNDVHALISQLHVWMLGAHNALEARLEGEGVRAADRFDEARRLLRWHYQWVVLHEYLDVTVGTELASEVRSGSDRMLPVEEPVVLPVEFADAAFRYGHGQVRERYRLRPDGPERRLFPDLAGFRPIEDRWVDPSMLFDLPGREPAQRVKALDGRLAASLIRLPEEITGTLEAEHHQSLAVRDLQRGVATGLPSGEAIARRLGVEPLDADAVGVAAHGWIGETPLWFYVLKESEVVAGGRHLGPVGGRIVAEVMVSVIERDPTSYLSTEPGWSPVVEQGADFGVADLIALAGHDRR